MAGRTLMTRSFSSAFLALGIRTLSIASRTCWWYVTSLSVYALSNAAPFRVLRFATFLRASLFRLLLVALSSGVTPSFFTSAEACLLTAVWSVIMRCANSDTCLFLVRDLASLPALISIWFAATTIPAICGSDGPPLSWAEAVTRKREAARATAIFDGFMVSPMGRGNLVRSRAGSFPAFFELRQHARDDAVAACSGKCECVAVGEVDFLRERLAQQAPRAEEARAHRRLRDAERDGGFLDGQLLQRAQHEHGPECAGQLVDLGLEQPARLCALGGAFRLLRYSFVHVSLHDLAVL